jgi:hypothetical protein
MPPPQKKTTFFQKEKHGVFSAFLLQLETAGFWFFSRNPASHLATLTE